MHMNSVFLLEMNSVLWIVKFLNASRNLKLTPKMMNSKMMNSVLMNSNWWIVNFQSLGIDLKWWVVAVFPSKRNFIPKFSFCWSLKWYWWKDDNIWEFQRTNTIGIRLCFNRSTSRSMISTGSPTRFQFVIGLDSFQWNHKWLIWKLFLEIWKCETWLCDPAVL